MRIAGPTPAPGPSAIARLRSSASSASNPVGVGERRDHHRGQMRGVFCDRVGRAGQRDDAGAGAQRRAGGEPGGAGPMRRAAEYEHRAAGVFVAVGVGARHRVRARGQAR